MSDLLPQGFDIGELYCIQVGLPKDGSFTLIPGAPTVESDDTRAKANLLLSPAGAEFSIQSIWQIDATALEAARAAIAGRYPDVEEITLLPAELAYTTGSLTINGPDAAPHTVGPMPASGLSANRVVFKDTLNDTDKQAVLSALRGNAGLLTLRYTATLSLNEVATVQVTGDLVKAIQTLVPKPVEQESGGWFGWKHKKPTPPPPPPPDEEACTTAVNYAIATGELQVVQANTPNAPEQVRAKATADVVATLAKMLLRRVQQPDAVDLTSFPVRLESTVPERVTFRISRSADIGVWFAQNRGAPLVTSTLTPIKGE